MTYQHVRQARHTHYNNVLRFENVAAIDGPFRKVYMFHTRKLFHVKKS